MATRALVPKKGTAVTDDRDARIRAKLRELFDVFLESASNDSGVSMYVHMLRGPFKPFLNSRIEGLTTEQCEGIRALARELADA